jgi:hypothetical protein
VLSEEVTAVLVRHLRHAATLLPIAKGAEVARQWLLALERACRDMSGIGDVVGGSGVLFAALHEGGHLAVMPSVVSASAAAKLLVAVTPLVEQVSRRRWALRVSALLDPQSVIFRKLARRAPATCRLATNAPPCARTDRTGSSSQARCARRENRPVRTGRSSSPRNSLRRTQNSSGCGPTSPSCAERSCRQVGIQRPQHPRARPWDDEPSA